MEAPQIEGDLDACLGIAPVVQSWALNRELRPLLDQLLAQVLSFRGQFEVRIDRAPVMQSPKSYAARLATEAPLIEINGFLLDRSTHPLELKRFLVLHELMHSLFFRAPESARRLIQQTGLDEEQACDLVALYGVGRSE